MLKTLRKAILSATAALMASIVVLAQGPQTVRGTVTDPSGETVVGGSVFVKGTQTGTVTDIDKGLYFKDVPTSGNISFADDNLKAALVAAYDTNGDGELSYTEADAVTSISSSVFGSNKNYTSFN
jgi:hypothetical protein